MSTDSTGRFITDEGTPIELDDQDRPLGPDNEPLQKNDQGQYIYPELGKETSVLPSVGEEREGIEPSDAATTKESATQVILPDGTPLRVDDQGNFVTDDGKIIRKDDDGNFVDEQNRILPTNDQGQAVFVEPAVTTLKPRLEIVDKETGELLPTQEDGTVLDIHGQPISTDSSGHPLSKSGEPLPTTSDGKYLSIDEVHTTARILPTDDQGQPLSEVIGPDNSPLPTNSEGDYVSSDGSVIRKNEDGQFIDQDNNVLPTNDQGQAIVVPSEASTPKPTYQVVDEQGRPLPTDPSTGLSFL